MSLTATKRRIKVGDLLKLVRHDWVVTGGLVIHGNTGITRLPSKINIGDVRAVAAVHNTEIGFHTRDAEGNYLGLSWLHWPAARDYRDTPDGFEIDLNRAGDFRECIGYRFV